MKKTILCIAACLLLNACSVMSHFRHEPAAPVQQTFDETREGILVFGLADQHARVRLEAGDIIKDSLYRVDWTNLYPIFSGGASNGYVLVRVPADRPIAITSISLENSWTEFWSGGPFQTCKGQKVAVFQVPKGKVLYYSDFDFHPEGRSLLFSAKENFEGAEKYVDDHYPELAGLLQPASFSSLTREDDCQKLRPKATEVAAR